MKCPNCDVEFPGTPGDVCPRCGWRDATREPVSPGLPMDQISELGFLSAFVQTTFCCLTSPSNSFAKIRSGVSSSLAAFYYIVMETGAILVSTFIIMFFFILSQNAQTADDASSSILVSGLVVPAAAFFQILLTACLGPAILHMAGTVSRSTPGGFNVTARVFWYAVGCTAPIQAIPFIGWAAAPFFAMAIYVIGAGAAHKVSKVRAAFPLLVLILGFLLFVGITSFVAVFL
ncbi:MAG TPA: hypothetical protein PL033_07920 [Candidatus Brocadiia bacterium]|nr:hypothetical protein [Candidatus Brocadiia bacterium]